jgi:hypothetical protein
MVGRARVELATSRLSGVRSNHLSYRPIIANPNRPKDRRRLIASSGSNKLEQHPKGALKSLSLLQKMKGHEDDGNVS